MFQVVRVDSHRAEALEPLGTKRKFWYLEGDRRFLFKAEERGTGEDWAEKIACELCRLLGLPHVHYELAHDENANLPGVVCETCAPRPFALVLGNQMMLQRDPAYPAGENNRYKVRAHTVEAVAEVLRPLAPPRSPWPEGAPDGSSSALDVFVGYVMPDAWIANQDRHHENWGALDDGEGLWLAPTFDHGASMARNLSDVERHERMTTRDTRRKISAFSRRARSAFYLSSQQKRPLTTIDAWHAFADLAPDAAQIWLARLAGIDNPTVGNLLAQVPPTRMSTICRDFTGNLLQEHQAGLLVDGTLT